MVDVPESFGMNFTFDSDVELVEQDFFVSVAFDYPPNDPDYDRQWALPHIQAETGLERGGRTRSDHRRRHRYRRLYEP